MNNVILIIGEKTTKEFGLFDENLSFEYLFPSLKYVQDKYMSLILGDDFYNDILDNIKNDSLSDDYKYLINHHIKYVLLWALMSESQVPISFKFRNSGFVTNQNEDGANVFLNDIKYTKQFYQNTANFYIKQLENYLNKNYKTFPKYKKCNTDNNFRCNIVL